MSNEIRKQTLSYMISLYPDIKDKILSDFISANNLDVSSLAQDLLLQAINNTIPILMSFNENSFELTNHELITNQENSRMIMIGNKSYKTTINLTLNIEEVAGN